MNPYKNFVSESVRLLKEGRKFPLGAFPPAPRPQIAKDAPKALFFAPHPDDETIVGALALRIFREARMNLIDVAVECGFSSHSHLSRVFRQLTGVTPSEYRHNIS